MPDAPPDNAATRSPRDTPPGPGRSQGDGGPFGDLETYARFRRLGTIALSPDGRRVVAVASQPNPDGTAYASALWSVDVDGVQPPRRLTRSDEGESAPVFEPDGSLLFLSRRPVGSAGADPDPGGDEDGHDADPDPGAGGGGKEPKPALWRLPAAGGDAVPVAERAGGVSGVLVSRGSGTVLVTADVLPGADNHQADDPADATADDSVDRERRRARETAGVTALLHAGARVRYWDHDLGPGEPHALLADGTTGDTRLSLRDLTPAPGRALDEAEFDLAADGSLVVATWGVAEPGGDLRTDLVAVDPVAIDPGGRRRVLCSDPDHDYGDPAVSADGSTIACVRTRRSTPDAPVDRVLWLVEADGTGGRELAADWDRWPGHPRWSPDGARIYVVADEDGRSPVFAVETGIGTGAGYGTVTRLTGDGAYGDLQVDPGGRYLYATRTAYDDAGSIVRLTLPGSGGADGRADELTLQGPVHTPDLPGRLVEVDTTVADGTRVRAWLTLPDVASNANPAPLLLWVHGGPLGSWNTWSWRWNPWLMVARGYAVLLPDPALSTGYGLAMVERGWGDWGGAPFTDLMTITDAALQRDDLDPTLTAAMGGSFGGYMANWIAGHTDRFAAIVTHAGLWSLDQFGATTDLPAYWRREMTPERAVANSPSGSADAIVTPMLVIHGDKDYRVPIGEGLRLWWDLVARHHGDEADLPHRFLYYPSENHWVLHPGNATVWYATVLAFLDWHVLGRDWVVPDLL